MFDDDDTEGLKPRYSYFHSPEPEKFGPGGTYADPTAKTQCPAYEWTHSMSDILNALIGAGLRLEFVHEFPLGSHTQFPFMEKCEDGWWRLKEGQVRIPLMFSAKCVKQAVETNG